MSLFAPLCVATQARGFSGAELLGTGESLQGKLGLSTVTLGSIFRTEAAQQILRDQTFSFFNAALMLSRPSLLLEMEYFEWVKHEEGSKKPFTYDCF